MRRLSSPPKWPNRCHEAQISLPSAGAQVERSHHANPWKEVPSVQSARCSRDAAGPTGSRPGSRAEGGATVETSCPHLGGASAGDGGDCGAVAHSGASRGSRANGRLIAAVYNDSPFPLEYVGGWSQYGFYETPTNVDGRGPFPVPDPGFDRSSTGGLALLRFRELLQRLVHLQGDRAPHRRRRSSTSRCRSTATERIRSQSCARTIAARVRRLADLDASALDLEAHRRRPRPT